MNEKTKKQFNDMQQQDIDKYNQLVRNVQKNVDKILSEWRQQTTAQLNKIQQATIELEKVPGIMGKTVNDIDNNLKLHTEKQHQNLQVLIEQLQTMPEVMKDGMNIMNGDMKSQMDRQLSEIQHVCEQLNTISEAMKKEVSNGVNAVNETFDGTNKIILPDPIPYVDEFLMGAGIVTKIISFYTHPILFVLKYLILAVGIISVLMLVYK